MTMLSKEPDPTKTDAGANVPYPTGYILIAFPNAEDALDVQRQLIGEGRNAREVMHLTAQRVEERSAREIDNAGWMASAGYTVRALHTHNQLARDGCEFLLVYAPEQDDTERIMRTVRTVPYRLAQKYHRLTIEDL